MYCRAPTVRQSIGPGQMPWQRSIDRKTQSLRHTIQNLCTKMHPQCVSLHHRLQRSMHHGIQTSIVHSVLHGRGRLPQRCHLLQHTTVGSLFVSKTFHEEFLSHRHLHLHLRGTSNDNNSNHNPIHSCRAIKPEPKSTRRKHSFALCGCVWNVCL